MTTEETQSLLLDDLISRLAERLQRVPTEDEVIDFIMGSEQERQTIWDKVQEEQN